MLKYKLLLLILLQIISYSVFSQKDTSKLPIPRYQVVGAVQDLVRFEGLKQMHEMVRDQLANANRTIALKDSEILNLQQQNSNLTQERDNQKALKDNSDLAYKGEVKKNKLLKVIIGGLIAYAGYSTFK